MASLLVIEDDPLLTTLLQRLLFDDGHTVTFAADGVIGLHMAQSREFDLIVLDLMLPDMDGERVLASMLQQRRDSRVLVLSSVTEIGRRVAVLTAGAVDFVPKPFENAELLARIRTRIRKLGEEIPEGRFLVVAGLRIDVERREVIVDERHTSLSQREFVLLKYMLRRLGEVCTRQELLTNVWELDFDPGTNVVDVYVRRLRSKVRTDQIETVHNVGYRLVGV